MKIAYDNALRRHAIDHPAFCRYATEKLIQSAHNSLTLTFRLSLNPLHATLGTLARRAKWESSELTFRHRNLLLKFRTQDPACWYLSVREQLLLG
jgi:hypothetical protein